MKKNIKMDTEKESLYKDLDKMSTNQILKNINTEDQKVALAVKKQLGAIKCLIDEVVCALQNGGRLFYVGAGTSGRMGILDASECPPTFGVDSNVVVGIIAGGDKAIREAVEDSEDDTILGFQDLLVYNITKKDFVIGIASSGKTPYVLSALKKCKQKGIKTGCVVCSKNSPIGSLVDFPICVQVGPEFLTGSTRMKAGTAQKMVLNMITTASMIKLGRVKGNKMSHMRLSNEKLIARAIDTIVELKNIHKKEAIELLKKYNNNLQKVLDL